MLRRTFTMAAIAGAVSTQAWGQGPPPSAIGERVRSVLNAERLDYLEAKLALDALVDPSMNEMRTLRAVEAMCARARVLSGDDADDSRKIGAARTLIYEAGPWNEAQPFAYDHSDPYGRDVRNKILATYLRTRLSNCVSMPILFLVVADRLGANVALAMAPLHVFVRHIAADGRAVNLETTSGALPARDAWYRQNLPMSDEAVANGVYMRTLSRKEGAALMATTVMEHLVAERRYQDAIDVGDAILEASPRDAETMVRRASAWGHLLRREFPGVEMPAAVDPTRRERFETLARMNFDGFARAEALGWREAETE
jgi:regulator of sirC expression with transglutaminase-like and TPR domain